MSNDDPPIIRSRRTLLRPRGSSEHAQSLVEFALVLPIFLLVIMAVVDFSWALRSQMIITNAAREGARVGAIGATVATMENTVVSRSGGLLTTSDVTVTPDPVGASGTTIKVDATYEYHFITPLGPFLTMVTGGAIDNPLGLTSSTTMRRE